MHILTACVCGLPYPIHFPNSAWKSQQHPWASTPPRPPGGNAECRCRASHLCTGTSAPLPTSAVSSAWLVAISRKVLMLRYEIHSESLKWMACEADYRYSGWSTECNNTYPPKTQVTCCLPNCSFAFFPLQLFRTKQSKRKEIMKNWMIYWTFSTFKASRFVVTWISKRRWLIFKDYRGWPEKSQAPVLVALVLVASVHATSFCCGHFS